MKIGVFDSGIGGESVVVAINNELPDLQIDFRKDTENLPYGDKTPSQLLEFVLPILQSMEADGSEVIVVACNSVTTTIITELRAKLGVPLIGIEPMVKTASEISKTRIATVCATPTTLHSKRYAWLKETYAADMKIIEPDCSKWAEMIEKNEVNHHLLATTIEGVIEQGADVIVMGCTHYHWIEEDVLALAKGRAQVIQPEAAVVRQLKQVLEQLQ